MAIISRDVGDIPELRESLPEIIVAAALHRDGKVYVYRRLRGGGTVEFDQTPPQPASSGGAQPASSGDAPPANTAKGGDSQGHFFFVV